MNATTDSTPDCAPDEAVRQADGTLRQPAWAGAPLWARLRLLMLPAVFAVALYGLHLQLGHLGLYGFAVVLGLIVLADLRNGPETLLALTVVYLPLSRLYAARLAPGLNGTNLLELALVFAWVSDSVRRGQPLLRRHPFTRIAAIWLALSLLSVLTAIAALGLQPFFWKYLQILRTYLDQFIIFFLFVNMIRDRNSARRIMVYMMFSATLVYLYGIHEWWGTRGLSSIEKSRLLGPVGQPNDFAALVVYSVAPFLAWGAFYFPRWKSLRVAPMVLAGVKVLLGCFSRGAYLAFAMQGLGVSFVKSRRFFVFVLAVLAGIYLFVPALVPTSLKARIGQTYQDRVPGTGIDKSADSRLILWDAAIQMTRDHPLLGEGFDRFSSLVPSHVSGFDDGVTGGATDNQNMFLYAASNMGLPGLVALVWLVLAVGLAGWRLYADRDACDIDRIAGLSAATMVAGLIGVNMFGTHMIDSSVDGLFWVMVAVLSRLLPARRQRAAPAAGAPRRG